MSTLVIKDVPEELHARLKERARSHHRSLTKEALALLEEGVLREPTRRPLPPPVRLKSGHPLTVEEIEAAIAEGRE